MSARHPAIPSTYDLFSLPQHVWTPVHRETIELSPVNFQNNSGQVLFQFNSGDSSFLRAQWILTGEFHLESGGATPKLTGTQRCSIINNAVLTNFRNCSLTWNDTTVESYNNLWHHYADFMVNYSYKESAKNTYVRQLCLSYNDEVGKYNDMESQGMKWRRQQLELSKIYQFHMPMPLSLCSCDRLFPPGQRFNLTLEHASDRLRTMSAADTDGFKVVYDRLALQIERIWLPQPLVKDIYNKFNNQGYMEYRMRRWSALGPFQLSSTSTLLNIDIGRCKQPLALITCFVDENAFHGLNTKTPLNYPCVPLSSAVCRWGARKIPSMDVQYNLGGLLMINPRAAQLYASFVSLVNGGLTNATSYDVDWQRFLFNQFFVCFEFATESAAPELQQTQGSGESVAQQEHLTIQYTLTEPCTNEKYVIIFGITDDSINLMSASGGVKLSYTPSAL